MFKGEADLGSNLVVVYLWNRKEMPREVLVRVSEVTSVYHRDRTLFID